MSDALSTLRALVAPKKGLQRIPFPLESYQHASPPLSAKRLLNLHAEQAPADARTQAALVSTAGMTVLRRLGTGPIKALNDELPGRIYVVSGTHLYRITAPGDIIDDMGDIGTPQLGTVPPYALMYTIAAGATAVVVCVPPKAYTASHNPGEPLNEITGTFPGAASVAFMDGYFVYTDFSNSARFFVTHLLDPTMYSALDFAYSDGLPNVLRRVVSHRGDLWMMGEGGLEIWYNAGAQDFPFRRQSGGVIAYTSASPQAVAKGDGSVFWLGLDEIVYRSAGYRAERISTHAIENIIHTFGAYGVASGFCYSQVGHTFYVLNFATRTLVYDCATKLWHDRASDAAGAGRWRPDATAHFGQQLFFGDSTSNKLFVAALDPYQGAREDDEPITRQLIFPPLWAGTKRAFCNRVEVELESGSGGLVDHAVTLDWSDDGGFIWNGGPRVMTAMLGAFNRRQRVFTTRLGSFHQRVFRLTFRGACTIYGMDADISPGAGG